MYVQVSAYVECEQVYAWWEDEANLRLTFFIRNKLKTSSSTSPLTIYSLFSSHIAEFLRFDFLSPKKQEKEKYS